MTESPQAINLEQGSKSCTGKAGSAYWWELDMGTGNYFSDCCQESEQAGWTVLSSALYMWQEVPRQARTGFYSSCPWHVTELKETSCTMWHENPTWRSVLPDTVILSYIRCMAEVYRHVLTELVRWRGTGQFAHQEIFCIQANTILKIQVCRKRVKTTFSIPPSFSHLS